MNIFKAVKKTTLLVICLVAVSSCDNSKTSERVFPNEAASSACESSTLSNRYVVQWEDGSYTVEKTAPGTTDEDFRNSFVDKNLANLKHVDRDYEIKIHIEQASTNDVHEFAGAMTWGPEKIEANSAWAQGYYGQGIKVGVVDGFVDETHVQLSGNVLSSEQFNSETNDPNINIHGTHVAGIIAADPNKGFVTGVAPKAKILAAQFIGNEGGGSLGDAILAMTSVANKGAKIINMSWGGAPCVSNLRSALETLSNRGILIVTAAGNDGKNSDINPDYPAAFNLLNQINVAASTVDDFFAYFSNRGYRTVHVAAPGANIYSTIPGNNTKSMDGTSMAAPMVSGAAALIWSAFPNASSQQIKQALYSSVDTNYDYQVNTRGRINVRKALDTLKNMLSSP